MIIDTQKNKYELKSTVISAFKKSSITSVVYNAIISAGEGSRNLLYIFLFSFIWCGIKYPFSDGDHYFFLYVMSGLMSFWVFKFKILKEDYYTMNYGVGRRENDKNHDHRRRETFKKKLWDAGVDFESAERVMNYLEEDKEKSSFKYFDIRNLEVVLAGVIWGSLSLLLDKGERKDILIITCISGFCLFLLLLFFGFRRYRHGIWLSDLISFLKDYMEDLSEGRTWSKRD